MTEAEKSNDLKEVLKPFYQRASEAEDRLARLENALGDKRGKSLFGFIIDPDSGNEELSKIVSELQSKLDEVKAEQLAEREKAAKEMQKLTAENAKLQYRITHLVRSLREADCKLES
ncbi:PREDICTED: uncharacterized protein LOC104606267 isoform X1 [Nelumbo nucifera]|uniref:Uncharacterized protein LOC104606267 isoform X1 n=1 Tax=Nelumbo nucifera TaxID=4432 RepID=A0A1U8ATC1_NELNU|nr:PREDICTED: uncharacterized protein LOC104606267 isoform X1 [Nelumbo nucifera]